VFASPALCTSQRKINVIFHYFFLSSFHELRATHAVQHIFSTSESNEASYFKLEKMGFRIGQALAERYLFFIVSLSFLSLSHSLSHSHSLSLTHTHIFLIIYLDILSYSMTYHRIESQLDCVKFICKELWLQLFKKSVDNLRTNHKVLLPVSLSLSLSLSLNSCLTDPPQGIFVLKDNNFRWLKHLSADKEIASHYAVLPCGIIRGALATLGHTSTVSVELVNLPICMDLLTLSLILCYHSFSLTSFIHSGLFTIEIKQPNPST